MVYNDDDYDFQVVKFSSIKNVLGLTISFSHFIEIKWNFKLIKRIQIS